MTYLRKHYLSKIKNICSNHCKRYFPDTLQQVNIHLSTKIFYFIKLRCKSIQTNTTRLLSPLLIARAARTHIFIYKTIHIIQIFISIFHQMFYMLRLFKQNYLNINTLLFPAVSKFLDSVPTTDVVCFGEEEQLRTNVGFLHKCIPQQVVIKFPCEEAQQCTVDTKHHGTH